MPPHHALSRRRAATAAVGTVALAVAGGACIAVALTGPQPPPQPPLSALPAADAARTTAVAGTARRAAPSPRVVGPVLPRSEPRTLAIEAIGVQTPLLRLGQTAEGALEVPPPGPDYDKAGWYRYSPPPGSLGPAVIAGHVDSAAAGPSVFFRLGDLRRHDTVRISRADGSVAVFAVDEVRRFRKRTFPTQLVYGNTDHAALRLITCGGPFDRSSGHYRDNIVVLASLITRGSPVSPVPPAGSARRDPAR